MISLLLTRTICRTNSRVSDDLRRHDAHVTALLCNVQFYSTGLHLASILMTETKNAKCRDHIGRQFATISVAPKMVVSVPYYLHMKCLLLHKKTKNEEGIK